jgi:hypothetical protein
MTTAFQWIIDNAVDVQINKRGVVAQTISRDQTVRSVSRGGRVWKFVVTPSPGIRWQDPGVRAKIEAIDKADRFTVGTINFNQQAFNYIFGYLGDQTNTTGWTAAAVRGSDTLTMSALVSGYRFRAGDLIQFSGQDRVYSVIADVPPDTGTVQLNRPVLEPSATYTLIVGRAVNWKVICTNIPDYKITPTGLIEWTGPFEFTESLV